MPCVAAIIAGWRISGSKAVGDDNLIIGTDYGHSDSATEIQALRLLRSKEKIAPVLVDERLCHNPARFYGLE